MVVVVAFVCGTLVGWASVVRFTTETMLSKHTKITFSGKMQFYLSALRLVFQSLAQVGRVHAAFQARQLARLAVYCRSVYYPDLWWFINSVYKQV